MAFEYPIRMKWQISYDVLCQSGISTKTKHLCQYAVEAVKKAVYTLRYARVLLGAIYKLSHKKDL